MEEIIKQRIKQASKQIPSIEQDEIGPKTHYFLTCNICRAVYLSLEKSALHEVATGHKSFTVYSEVDEKIEESGIFGVFSQKRK